MQTVLSPTSRKNNLKRKCIYIFMNEKAVSFQQKEKFQSDILTVMLFVLIDLTSV